MRGMVSYRVVAVGSFGLLVVSWTLPGTQRMPIAEGGGVSFDLCSMWEQLAWSASLGSLAVMGSCLGLPNYGVRNRHAPRWPAVAGLLGLWPLVQHSLWRVQNCYGEAQAIAFWAWVGAHALICLRHAARWGV